MVRADAESGGRTSRSARTSGQPERPEVYSVQWLLEDGDTDYEVVWDDYTPVALIPGLTAPRHFISGRRVEPKVRASKWSGWFGATPKMTAHSIVIPGDRCVLTVRRGGRVRL